MTKRKEEIEQFIYNNFNNIEKGDVWDIIPTRLGGCMRLVHGIYSLSLLKNFAMFVNAREIDFDSTGSELLIVWQY